MNAVDQKRTWRISARLKEARANAKEKMSQAELARRVQARGVAKFPSGVASRIELGYTYATWQEVEALAAVLGVDPQWLGGNDGVNQSPDVTPAAATPAEIKPAKAAKPAVGKKAKAPSPAPAAPPPVAPAPVGMSAAAAARPAPETKVEETASADTPPVIISIVPPTTELPPLAVPARGDLSSSDYRIRLGTERRKTEELMAKSGLTPAEWRQQREYHRALTEVLRTLVG